MGHCLMMRKGSVHTTPGKVLPAGYTKLQYIQSTGTQYVDTGFNPKSTSRVVMEFEFLTNATASPFMSRDISNDTNMFGVFNINGRLRSDFNTTKVSFSTGLSPLQKLLYDRNKNVCTIGTETITNANGTFSAPHPLFLFASDDSGTASYFATGKLYSCRIFDNESLIRDFVPCKGPSGVVGLYDLTGKQFYGNSGTGVFYAGPPVVTLPEGYTQLMYLESSGTQYINTGFTPNQDARIQLDCERTAANATDHFFGVRTGNSASSAFAFYIYNSGWRWAYNNATATGTGPDIGRYFIDANKNVTTINGDTTLTGTYASFTAAAAAPLFAMLSAPSGFSYGSFRLYTCRIYNNGLMVRNFIPCRNASGTIGLYDLVNGQFYTNAGTGTFTAGEVT